MRNPSRNCPAYPGAADPMDVRQKGLNILTCVVSGIGFATAMLYLILL